MFSFALSDPRVAQGLPWATIFRPIGVLEEALWQWEKTWPNEFGRGTGAMYRATLFEEKGATQKAAIAAIASIDRLRRSPGNQ